MQLAACKSSCFMLVMRFSPILWDCALLCMRQARPRSGIGANFAVPDITAVATSQHDALMRI